MKRAAAAATLTIGIGLALPGASGAAHRDKDVVTGVAKNTFPGGGPSKLNADAFSGPTGANPGGQVRVRGDLDGARPMGPFRFFGKVTCLRVSGHRAAIKYRFDEAKGSGAPFEGGGVQVFIEDNGEGRHGKLVDASAFDPPQTKGEFQATAGQCDNPDTRADYDPVDSGDYVVRDRKR